MGGRCAAGTQKARDQEIKCSAKLSPAQILNILMDIYNSGKKIYNNFSLRPNSFLRINTKLFGMVLVYTEFYNNATNEFCFVYTFYYELSAQPFGKSHQQWQSHSQPLSQGYSHLDLSVL